MKSYLNNSIIWNVLIFIFISDSTEATKWSCFENATSQSVDLSEISGLWYEIARFPPSKMPACLEVNASSAIEHDEFVLHLNYVHNLNKKWNRMEEDLVFPWNDHTQSGLFELLYSDDKIKVGITFKYLGTFGNYTLVCGYSGLASGVSMLRLLSRDTIVSSEMQNTVDGLLKTYGINSGQLTWVEQGGRCNGASCLLSNLLNGTVALLVLMNIINIFYSI